MLCAVSGLSHVQSLVRAAGSGNDSHMFALQLREVEGGDLAEGTNLALIERQTDAKVIPPAAGGYHFS